MSNGNFWDTDKNRPLSVLISSSPPKKQLFNILSCQSRKVVMQKHEVKTEKSRRENKKTTVG